MIVAVMVMSMVVFVSLVVAAVLVPMLVVMMGVIHARGYGDVRMSQRGRSLDAEMAA